MALAKAGYAATRLLNGDDGEFTVFVQPDQTAGGELVGILNRHGYLQQYVTPHDSADFALSIQCEPISWYYPKGKC